MKYLNSYQLFESLVDKKIQLLKDLSLELEDAGLQVEIVNGSHSHLLRDPRVSIHTGSRYTEDYKKFIIMKVTDDNERFDTDLYNTEIINEFKETLKSYHIEPRSMSGGRNFCVFKFDKHGHMTNSPVIRESYEMTDFDKEVRTIEDNINDILLELNDLYITTTCDFTEGRVKHKGVYEPGYFFLIGIEKETNDYEISNGEVHEVLQRLVEYVDSVGWSNISMNIDGNTISDARKAISTMGRKFGQSGKGWCSPYYQTFYGMTLYISKG